MYYLLVDEVKWKKKKKGKVDDERDCGALLWGRLIWMHFRSTSFLFESRAPRLRWGCFDFATSRNRGCVRIWMHLLGIFNYLNHILWYRSEFQMLVDFSSRIFDFRIGFRAKNVRKVRNVFLNSDIFRTKIERKCEQSYHRLCVKDKCSERDKARRGARSSADN